MAPSAAASSASLAPPLHLLASSVRNASEATALVDVDLLALRHEVLHDHLLACCAHERELQRTHDIVTRRAAGDEHSQLRAAAALCATALATVRANIAMLVAEADEVIRGLCESTIQRHAESNEALAAELAEEGAPMLAAAKQRLWLVEESLAHRMSRMLATLRDRMAAEADGGGREAQVT